MIYYIIPQYEDGCGSCCIVSASNGETVYREPMHRTFRRMLNDRCIDLKTVRRMCSKLLLQKNLIPLYLSPEEILMPVKVRVPRVKRDGGYGYVNYKAVSLVNQKELRLINGECFVFLESRRTILRRFKASERLDSYMKSKVIGIEESVIQTMDNPATKADVAVLAQEMLYIRKQLNDLINRK